jgi:Glutathione S-transferase, N-terminal domain
MEMTAAQDAQHALWDSTWQEADGERTIRARSAAQSAPTTLYCSWFCPFAQRAWIALEEKDVDYKYVEINPYEVGSFFPS